MNKFSDTIFLEGIELFGYIGVFPEEKENGQIFVVDVEMCVDLREAGEADRLSQTVSYAEVYSVAEQLMKEARYDLIESYATQLAKEVFSYFDLVSSLKVTVRKPQAPINGKFRSVGVSIYRKRDE